MLTCALITSPFDGPVILVNVCHGFGCKQMQHVATALVECHASAGVECACKSVAACVQLFTTIRRAVTAAAVTAFCSCNKTRPQVAEHQTPRRYRDKPQRTFTGWLQAMCVPVAAAAASTTCLLNIATLQNLWQTLWQTSCKLQ